MIRFLALLSLCLMAFPAWAQIGLPAGQAQLFPQTASSSYQGLGDVVSSGQQNYWGLRAYSLATAGTKSINICNSGGSCFDINTLANGKFDATTYTADCTTCSVDIVYDKVGTNNYLCGSGAYSSGCPTVNLTAVNGQACLEIVPVTTNNVFKTSAVIGLTSQPFSIIHEAEYVGTSGAFLVSWGDFSGNNGVVMANNEISSGPSGSVTVTTNGVPFSMIMVYNGASSQGYLNGTTYSQTDSGVFGASDGLSTYNQSVGPTNEFWCEQDVITQDVTTSLSAIHANQAAFW